MKRIVHLLCVNFLTCVAAFGAVHSFPPELDAYIEKARRDWNVPGLAIAIVDGEGVVAAKGYGVRRLGASDPVDADTRFDIASLSKSFNTAMIATLVDEKKLRWDDRVRDVLPAIVFPDAMRDNEVTLRDLLAHRVALESGNLFLRFSGYDRAETFRRIRYFRPQGTFRGDYVYSNIMYSVSGAMAEAVSNKTWSALVRERLLEPLGMTSSNSDEELDGANWASPHAIIDGVQQPIRHFRFATVQPASGIVSTANDMAKWLRFQLGDGSWNGKPVVSAASMEVMHSPQMIIRTTPGMRSARGVDFFGAYGLGWNIMDYHGHPILWHSGNANGMPSYMAILPKEKLGVFVTINTWGAAFLHGALASRIFDTFLGFPREPLAPPQREQKREEKARVAGTHPTAALNDYAGVYGDTVFGDMAITREGDHLVLQFSKGKIADLTHWQNDAFAVRWREGIDREDYPTYAVFSLNENAKPVRLEMQMNQVRVVAIR
jgi:CubicO group peptidase (beta-lactamase class C family)